MTQRGRLGRTPVAGRDARRLRAGGARSYSLLSTAENAPWEAIHECVPSQNGFIVELPHRQSEGLRIGTSLPCASTSLNSPSIRYGPFSMILMVIDMMVRP